MTIKPDGQPIIHKFPDRQDIELWPVMDLHIGDKYHATETWKAFCRRVLQRENTYIVLGGDLLTNATRNSVGNGVFENTLRPREQKRVVVEMLKPLKPRILCGTTGNHERRSAKDADVDLMADVMYELGLEELYRENMALVKLQFGNPKNNGQTNPTYTMAVTHGSGGGSTGNIINRNERFGYSLRDCDILIVGHSHKPAITVPGRYCIDNRNNTSVKPLLVVSATSWLNFGGYAMQHMFTPTCIAPQVIRICGNKKEVEAATRVFY